ncbi:hypothetical protein [Tautonia sociabilis]|uniref:Uncharacterized protein n=1 Tax=Tautonia sociabilis TaxID=2080755 RepID=A0A432MPQ8_9BACT|nr:hypothetical protein [Tautonia sociabilis]RUL89008.1 hypothetical protein TsocGM_03870 [Tautonia sociabilis]
MEVVAIRPDEQCRRVLSLFEGARWPHPAAALADWKRSAPPGEERSLGKPLEALIAAINPLTARELATLHGARLRIDPAPAGGSVRWALLVPQDDGTIAALATAMTLTDGMPQDAEGPLQIDRLGPPGAPLSATAGPGTPAVVASDRDALRSAIAGAGEGPDSARSDSDSDSGWIVRVDPEALARSANLRARQLGRALEGLGYGTFLARASLDGESLRVAAEGKPFSGDRKDPWGEIDPDWLDSVPTDRASVMACLAVRPGGEGWGALLAAVDEIERADPARVGVAPLRTRLALLAIAHGARIETELWPALEGVTCWASFGGGGDADGVFLALHARDEGSAGRIADRIVSPIVLRGEEAGIDPGRRLGRIAGQPVDLARRGSSVFIGWGDGVLDEGLASLDDRDRSAGPLLRLGWGGAPPARVAAAWPSRLPIEAEQGGPLQAALEAGPPIVWLGWESEDGPRDVVRCDGLREPIRRFLDRVPAAPSPSGSSPIPEGSRP